MFLPLLSGRLSRCYGSPLRCSCLFLLLTGLLIAPVRAQTTYRLKAPDFEAAVGPTLGSDKAIRLKDLRGKIVILDFWTLC